MDLVSGAVLNKLFTLSPMGRYVVVDEDELLEVFPDGFDKSFNELKKALTFLCKDGYIDVKYSRGETYCIAPLKKYEPPVVLPVAEEQNEEPKRLKLNPVLISAFAGSAIGSLVITLILELIKYAK